MEQGRVTRADDLEMGTEPLLQSEVAHYVKAYPLKPEHIDISTLLSFEYNKKGQRIVFVENSLTHELMREFINDSQFQCDKETLTSDKYDEFDPLLSSDRSMVKKISPFVVNFSEAVSNYLRTFYLFIQGILAGFSFTTLYFVAAASPTTNITLFLRIYSPLAGEIRRYFFLLSSIALLGSIDTFLTTFQHSSNSKSKLLKSIQPKVRVPIVLENLPHI